MTPRLDDLVPYPGVGRRFTLTVRGGLADAAPGGRVRLDALARWLQDVAHADVRDAGLADRALWVVRRARLRVTRFPRFDEPATLETFSSGLGRAWAERRTTITTPGGGHVEAVTLWVHLDRRDGRPAPLREDELALYGPSAAGRMVRSRLRHPAPPAGATGRPWTFRAAELDVADHINNAASWTPLEEELLAGGRDRAADGIDTELEYRAPAQPGPHTVLAHGDRRWIVDAAGEVCSSLLLAGGAAPAPAD